MRIFDISVPLSSELPTYPGDPVLEIIPVQRIDRGDAANVSRLIMSSHSGTHVDAPRHFVEAGASVDQIPLETLVGPARVVEIRGPGEVTADTLRRLPLGGAGRLLLKTVNSDLLERTDFEASYVSLSADGARFLVEAGVRLVGIDYLSVERFHGDGTVHRILLDAGVIIVEGVNLAEVPAGDYELVCLPLRVAGGDGAPGRAILISRNAVHSSSFDPHTSRWPLS